MDHSSQGQRRWNGDTNTTIEKLFDETVMCKTLIISNHN